MKRLRISPAHILSRYIIDGIALASDPSDSDDWPMYISSLPDGPQVNTNCAVVYDTSGIKDGRYMTGEVVIHPGVQIRIRSRDYDTAYNKIEEISLALDAIQNNLIIIGSYEYKIINASRTTPIIYIGVDDNSSTKRRSNFTSNFLLTLTLREIQNYIKVLNDSIGMSDVVSSESIIEYIKVLNDSIGMSDVVSSESIIEYIKVLNESIGMSDVVSSESITEYIKVLNDSIGMSDVVSSESITEYIKVLNESIGIEDIIVSSNSFNRNISESVGIEDIIDKSLVKGPALVFPSVRNMLGSLPDSADTLEQGLVLKYDMLEAGGNKIYDQSYDGNDGSLEGDAHFVLSEMGPALDFNGTGDYVNCGNNESLNSTDVTVSAWINTSAIDHLRVIVSKYITVAESRSWLFRLSGKKLQIRLSADGASNTSMDTVDEIVSVGQWYHVAFTKGRTTKCYVNGIEKALDGDFTDDLFPTSTNVLIGDYAGASVQMFTGQIGPIRIYNRALTEQEVMQLYIKEQNPFI